jgi:hypothetical protein
MSIMSSADLKDLLDNFYALPVDQHYQVGNSNLASRSKKLLNKSDLLCSQGSSDVNTSCNSWDSDPESVKSSESTSSFSMFNNNCFETLKGSKDSKDKIKLTSFLQPRWEQNVKLQKKCILERFFKATSAKTSKSSRNLLVQESKKTVRACAPSQRIAYRGATFIGYN